LLGSTRDPNYHYIGECGDLLKRLEEHATSNGAFGTSYHSKKPFLVAVYITGMKHDYQDHERMSIERRWKNAHDCLTCRKSVLNIIDAGESLVQEINSQDHRNGIFEKLVFVKLVCSR
jgi:predicted GIY-YIG superfamily endonuclease